MTLEKSLGGDITSSWREQFVLSYLTPAEHALAVESAASGSYERIEEVVRALMTFHLYDNPSFFSRHLRKVEDDGVADSPADSL